MAGKVAYMKDTTATARPTCETWYTGFRRGKHAAAGQPSAARARQSHLRRQRPARRHDRRRQRARTRSRFRSAAWIFASIRSRASSKPCPASGQFGLTFDDYGNRFVCSNRNPAIHVVLEDRYLKKNPLVAVAAVSHDVAKAGDESRVFPISARWTTSNLHAGQFTAACGLEIYRGDALPDEFYGNIFVCEPTGHLVHREIMQPHGVTFTSNAGLRRTSEFFASRDEWCSPGESGSRPRRRALRRRHVPRGHRAPRMDADGAAQSARSACTATTAAAFIASCPRISSGRPRRNLSTMSSDRLIEYLAHPNAWWRETAARLLLERQDKNVGPQLQRVALGARFSSGTDSRFARSAWPWPWLRTNSALRLLDDPQPRIVEQAIVFDESRLPVGSELSRKVAGLIRHSDPRMRFQALLTGRGMPSAPLFAVDSWEQEAMLIAARTSGGVMLSRCCGTNCWCRPTWMIQAIYRGIWHVWPQHRTMKNKPPLRIRALVRNTTYRRTGLASFLNEWRRRGKSPETLRESLSEPDTPLARTGVRRRCDDALDTISRNRSAARRSIYWPHNGDAHRNSSSPRAR